MNRLNIESQAGRSLQRPLRNKRIIRVTILDREETKYRRILNLVDLLEAAKEDEEAGNFEYDVRIVRFGGKSGPSFRQQLTIVSQTDVLVGVHGAGIVSKTINLVNNNDSKITSQGALAYCAIAI